MKIGDVAAKAGVSTRVLRYYEQQRLLSSTRTSAGHREYEQAAVDRVRLIQHFYGAGLSSKGIREMLPAVDAGEASPELLEFLAAERERVEQQIAELMATRDRLDDVIDAAINPQPHCPGVLRRAPAHIGLRLTPVSSPSLPPRWAESLPRGRETKMSEVFGYGEFGGPQVQEMFERPDPVPGPGEVLVQVTAAGVNPLDHKLRSGFAPEFFAGRPFPYVLGAEAAGVVLAVGDEVDGLEVGDAVFGMAPLGVGTFAVTTLLVAANTARKPEGLRDDWAATIPVAATSAIDAVDQIDLPSGATVLVIGVGGGVGVATAQVARDRGLTVIGTGGPAKRAAAEAVGVTFVDYTDDDVVARVRALAPDGVDGVVDLVGGQSLRDLAPLARDPKKVVSVTDPSVAELGGEMVRRRGDRVALERAATLMVEGRLDPHVVATYPLAKAAEAMALVENGHALGKVIIDPTL